jgi:hypothetical protein
VHLKDLFINIENNLYSLDIFGNFYFSEDLNAKELQPNQETSKELQPNHEIWLVSFILQGNFKSLTYERFF